MIFTAVLTFLQTIAIDLEPLSAPLVAWLNANMPEAAAKHQLRACKMYLRHNKITIGPGVLTVVQLFFPSKTLEMQSSIANLLTVELAKN